MTFTDALRVAAEALDAMAETAEDEDYQHEVEAAEAAIELLNQLEVALEKHEFVAVEPAANRVGRLQHNGGYLSGGSYVNPSWNIFWK